MRRTHARSPGGAAPLPALGPPGGPVGPGLRRLAALGLLAIASASPTTGALAQDEGPSMLVPDLRVEPVVGGLTTPIGLAFLGEDDFLVLEKDTGRVLRVVGGAVDSTVLDLAVNSASERGLLSIALDPDFPEDPGVYLYWTESTSGADSGDVAQTPLLGNRVDRFSWDGSTLAFEYNLIRIRALQVDAGQPGRGNHDGGVIRFGPDGMLSIIIGDLGRRGQMQNLRFGPTVLDAPVPDDQFGGPGPDDAHLSGVILRVDEQGQAPPDNPFFAVGASLGGEVGANIQKLFGYGVRNSFGMAFDPETGLLWTQENADDAFSELNLVGPGFNGGWIQVMGPIDRIRQFKLIEATMFGGAMQQIRWPPILIAYTPRLVLSRLFLLPGAEYTDPAFSWKFEVAPAGIAFVEGDGLGPDYEGDLLVGASRPFLAGGYLFRFDMNEDRDGFDFDDPRLDDGVADNLDKHEGTESESLLIGRDFGIGTDIQNGPDGFVYVVSLSLGTVYRILPAE
ncbi:PQQ-dependent sugar dehydrogenase [Tautonia plasticadhaerens]|uniref:Quinoprotein glucose dehydrogenase B n=1 Tax=Tautonia plasticadhaerens TaxID=2527974 RepID=A0A518H5C4_9BACT|nr:PQQ-dependent sugar dehydrogenase [Tautonia plasticadhaerens]QDV36045.1 Quinoprotein glucose dehydrogenase B precursor [Tautonia plasticadhaerens]